MWQMLTWLLQLLNRFFQHPLVGLGTYKSKSDREAQAVEILPELTNADLEVLFTQLLEGVYQARGQQWALKYLQRMADRITLERWLDWLLIFGERLLASPAPNHQLATKMVQLGELSIGPVGELAYEIGIQLLRRNSASHVQDHQEVLELESTDEIDPLLDSPGQRLLREWGEHLWGDSDQPEVSPAPTPVRLEQISLDRFPDQQEYIAENQVLVSGAETSLDLSRTDPPELPHALQDLVVRLEESNALVQKLATQLVTQEAQLVNQQSSQLTLVERSEQLFYQGLQLAKVGDLSGALDLYNQAIKLQPNSSQYWFNKALTLSYLRRFDEAISAYDQAINLKPDFCKAWYNRGGVLGEVGDFDGAIASFDQALNIQPDYPESWAARGLALLKLGWVVEAISSYDQALDLAPHDQETWYYRGIALAVGEQYPEAIAAYDRALAIQPDFYEVWIDRGVVLFNLNRWSEAIDSWDQALASQPELYLAWYNRGVALDNLSRREEAIFSYQQAIAIKSDFHLAWYNQAVALFYLQRFVESISCYDSALQIKPDYWEAWMGRAASAGSLARNYQVSSGLMAITSTLDSALHQIGDQGKLASYYQGLQYLRPDTHPEGWGRLHLAIANTLYEQGKDEPNPRDYWYKAVYEYQEALITLTAEEFPELHLELVQSFIKVLVGLREIAAARELQEISSDLLTLLLNQPTRLDESKKQLVLKLSGLGQLAVDLAVVVGDLVEAWEIAEHHKNAYWHYLLHGWSDTTIPSLPYTSYKSVQQLLNPSTAIIYWHISPSAIQTFIIKDQAPSPILIFTPIQDVEVIPEAVRNLIELENWLKNWHTLYQDYCKQTPESTARSNHSWRVDMERNLCDLQRILHIPTIIPELEGITHLILVAHRDLCRLPLHALFHLAPLVETELDARPNYTITYLPSIHIGICSTTRLVSNWLDRKLLVVESSPGDVATGVLQQMFNHCDRITGAQATKVEVINGLTNSHNIFHFAGQAINNYSEPSKTALMLAGTDKLTLAEVCQLTLSTYNLVTLADCEIVRNNHQTINSEYFGLDTGWLMAGIPHLVMPLWQISPDVSALFAIEFYHRLSLVQSPAIAFTETTAWLRDLTAVELINWFENLLSRLPAEASSTRAYLTTQIGLTRQLASDYQLYHHPYYWAAFTISGKI
jgi:tetratricopeptide (TPR) repeat protein